MRARIEFFIFSLYNYFGTNVKGGDMKKYLIKILEIISNPLISISININVSNSKISKDEQ